MEKESGPVFRPTHLHYNAGSAVLTGAAPSGSTRRPGYRRVTMSFSVTDSTPTVSR